MKKILLTITTAVLTTLSVNAQVVDYGFEVWADVPNANTGVQDPKGWASFNVLTNPFLGMKQTVYKETASPAVGSAAAKIVTQLIPSAVPVPGYDTVGILAIGAVDFASRSIKLGAPYITRSAKVTFSTKYEPASLDTGSVTVILTKYNSTTKIGEIVAQGLWRTSATSTTWAAQTIDLTYSLSNVDPDTVKIIASSSSLYRPKINSTLYIDDIKFSGYVSVNEYEAIKNNVIAYPTPAKANINFASSVNAKSLEILDIAGRNIGVFQMVNNKVTVETIKYDSGIYIYNVLNDQNQVVGRGKFEVVK